MLPPPTHAPRARPTPSQAAGRSALGRGRADAAPGPAFPAPPPPAPPGTLGGVVFGRSRQGCGQQGLRAFPTDACPAAAASVFRHPDLAMGDPQSARGAGQWASCRSAQCPAALVRCRALDKSLNLCKTPRLCRIARESRGSGPERRLVSSVKGSCWPGRAAKGNQPLKVGSGPGGPGRGDRPPPQPSSYSHTYLGQPLRRPSLPHPSSPHCLWLATTHSRVTQKYLIFISQHFDNFFFFLFFTN